MEKKLSQAELDTLRHDVKIHGTVIKDAFLYALMDLLCVRGESETFLGKRKVNAHMEQIAEYLGLNLYRELDSTGQLMLFNAYKDAARIFVDLGVDDQCYGRGFLNLVSLKEDKFKEKVQRDFYDIGTALPEMAGMTELFAPFARAIDAAQEEFFAEHNFD